MEYAVIFLPLAGAIIGFLGKSLSKFFAEITTCIFTVASAILSALIFYKGIIYKEYGNYKIFEWISSENFIANW